MWPCCRFYWRSSFWHLQGQPVMVGLSLWMPSQFRIFKKPVVKSFQSSYTKYYSTFSEWATESMLHLDELKSHKVSWFYFNSLSPGKFEWNFRHVIFKQIVMIDGWGISCEIALIWMSLDFTDYQSTSVHVMACCCQATSHYLRQCWPISLVAIWRH